jgi:hypothetical protein
VELQSGDIQKALEEMRGAGVQTKHTADVRS